MPLSSCGPPTPGRRRVSRTESDSVPASHRAIPGPAFLTLSKPSTPSYARARTHTHTQMDAFRTIMAKEGVRGFYRGWVANTVKVVPQNAIRMVSYEAMKNVMGVKKAKTDT